MDWNDNHLDHLRDMTNICERLSIIHKSRYDKLLRLQDRLKIPVIVLSGITGLCIASQQQVPTEASMFFQIGLSIVSFSITVIASIESYKNIPESVSKCMKTATELQRLIEEIKIEVDLPANERKMSGVSFCREVHSQFTTIMRGSVLIPNGQNKTALQILDEIEEKILKDKKKLLKRYRSQVSFDIDGGRSSSPVSLDNNDRV